MLEDGPYTSDAVKAALRAAAAAVRDRPVPVKPYSSNAVKAALRAAGRAVRDRPVSPIYPSYAVAAAFRARRTRNWRANESACIRGRNPAPGPPTPAQIHEIVDGELVFVREWSAPSATTIAPSSVRDYTFAAPSSSSAATGGIRLACSTAPSSSRAPTEALTEISEEDLLDGEMVVDQVVRAGSVVRSVGGASSGRAPTYLEASLHGYATSKYDDEDEGESADPEDDAHLHLFVAAFLDLHLLWLLWTSLCPWLLIHSSCPWLLKPTSTSISTCPGLLMTTFTYTSTCPWLLSPTSTSSLLLWPTSTSLCPWPTSLCPWLLMPMRLGMTTGNKRPTGSPL